MPKKKSKNAEKLAGVKDMSTPKKQTKADRAEETRHYNWILAQRIFDDAGLLESWKKEQLNRTMPSWNAIAVEDDLGYALNSDNEDVVEALEAWWNKLVSPEMPMNIAEIRALALADGHGKPEWALKPY